MSTIVGNVTKLEGIVRAINPVTGESRVLEAGSPVFAGEIIQTSSKGGVVVDMVNGSLLTLGRDTQMRLDDDVSGQASMLDSGTEGTVDIEALQQAILEGNFDALEATAAGEGFVVGSASDGGVIVERIAMTGDVTSGFETSVNNQVFNDVPRDAVQNTIVEDITASVVIGDAGTVQEADGVYLTYTVSLSNPVGTDVEVALNTSGTATSGDDYNSTLEYFDGRNWQPVSGNITLPADASAVQVRVAVKDDALNEGSETVILGATTTDPQIVDSSDTGTGVILDETGPYIPNDPNSPDAGATVSIDGDKTVWEGNQATYTVSTDTVSSSPIDVVVKTLEAVTNPATGDVDYISVDKTVTIPANQSSATFTVQTTDDAIADSGENFVAEIVSASGAQFEAVAVDAAANSVTTTIIDASDPTPPPGIPGIPDTPDAGATVSIDGDKTVWEGNQATYTVSTDTVSSSPIDVVVKTLEAVTNPATGDVDYISVDKTVTIPANQSSVTFTVQTTDDAIADSGENFVAEIVSASGAQFEAVAVDAAANSVTTTIIDASDPTPPPGIPGIPDTPDAGATVSIDGDKTVWEGNQATYTVSTDTVSSSPIDVVVKTLEAVTNPATGDVDYISVDKTVTIPANQSSVTFTVQTTDDAIADSGENFVAEIVSASGAQFEAVAVDAAANSVTTTIIDASDPTPPPGIPGIPDTPDAGATVSIDGDKTVWEGNQATYTVSTDTVSSSPIDVVVKTLEAVTNPATGDVDYISVDKTVTIPANQSSVTFTVQTTDDAIADSGENFVAEIVSASGAQFEAVAVDAAANSVTTTIIDASDPTPPPGIPGIPDTPDAGATVSIDGDKTVWEGNQATYTVSTDTVSSSPIDVVVKTLEAVTNPATGDVDYISVDKTVTIPANQSSVTFTVQTTDDAIADSGENFVAEIVSASGAQFEAVAVDAAANSVTTTIIDASDPTPPPGIPGIPDTPDAGATVSIDGDKTVWEGNQATYTVSTDTVSSSPIDVVVKTLEAVTNPATGDVDYISVDKTVTIPANQSSVTFTVQTTDDAIADSGENFVAEIVSASGAQFEAVAVDAAANSVTTTIIDASDPTPPPGIPGIPDTPDAGATVSIDGDKTVWEGNQATYTVSTDTVSSSPIDVVVKTLEAVTNPATGDVDYISVDKTVTIPANQSSVTFTVQTTDDAIADSGENFVAEIVSASGAQFEAVAVDAAANSVTTTIIDASDPTPPPGIPGIPDTPDSGTELSLSGSTSTLEGDAVEYTLSVTNAPLADMVIEITTSNITTNGDVVVGTQNVTIPAGLTEAKFTIDNVEDAIKENPEDYKVEITNYGTGGYEAVSLGQAEVITTITDDDSVTVVSITDDTQTEGTANNNLVHTVTMSGQSTTDEVYSFSLVDTTTQAVDHGTPVFSDGVSYDANTGLITVPAGVTSFTVSTTVTDDALADSGEYYTLTIGGQTATGTILDETNPYDPNNPDQPNEKDVGATVSIDGDKTVWEGNQATYTVSTDTVSSSPIDVVVKTLEAVTNPATGDVDYISVDKTVTIPANQSSATFTVQTTDDAIADSGENFVAEIVSASGAQFEAVAVDAAANSVTTTIIDASDPTPPPGIPGIPDTPDAGATVSIDGDKTVWEGNQATYTVSTDTVSSSPIDVVVKTLEAVTNPATGDVDYISVDKTVTIPANQSSVTFTVQTTDDAIADSGENFVAEIVSASGAQFEAVAVDAAANSVTTTIIDASDPTPPPGIPGIPDTPDAGATVSIDGDKTVWEGNQATYTVSTDTVSSSPIDVVVKTLEAVTNPATGDVDYISVDKTVTIPANQSSVTFTVQTTDDAIADSGENFVAEIVSASGAQFEAVAVDAAANSVTTTIIDASDPTPPPGIPGIPDTPDAGATVSIDGDKTVWEGNQATYTVSTDTVSSSPIDVVVKTLEAVTNPATGDVDYISVDKTVTIPANQSSATFTVQTTDDAIADSGENFVAEIVSASGAQFEAVAVDAAANSVTTTIIDASDPTPPPGIPGIPDTPDAGATVSIDGDKTVWEGNQATYTVSTDTVSSSPIDVVVKTLEAVTNPATGDVDYISVDKTVTIPANQSSATFTVQTTDDAIADSGENFVAEIVSASGAQFEAVAVDAAANSVTTTIIDASDPTPPPGIPGIPDTPDSGTELSLSGSTSTLEGDAVEYTLSVTNAPLADMVIEITTSNITTNGDVVVGTQNVTIPAGLTEAKFTIDNVEDAIKENPEDYKVEITNYGTGGYEAVSLGQAEVITTITDDDSVTVVSITDDTQTEGTANNNLVHTVTMSGQSTTDEVYSFSLVDTTTQAVDHGTPVFSDGVSYDANTGLITVPAGVTSFTVSTTVTDDALADSGEYYTLTIGGQTATGTILDETNPYDPNNPDQPNEKDVGATVSIDGDKTVWEGNQATYTVSTDTVSSSPIDVVVKTLEAVTNPATGDVDYISVDKTVTIPANQSSVTFTVQTTDDAIADSGENFVAEIVSASGAQFEAVAVDAAANSVTTTIIDASDPTPPPGIPGIPDTPDAGATVSIDGDKTVWEGNQATYTVSTDTVSSSPIDVVVKTLEAVTNPATGDVDYISVDKTVTIPANQSSVTFTVQTTDDAIADSGENFVAEIVSASGAQFEAVAVDAAANSVTTTIIDASDPTPPPGIPGIPDTPDAGATVSIDGDKTVWEGNQATYTVSTDTVSSSPIDVVVKTLEAVTNPATGDVDYISVDKTVTIPANQSSATFTVQTTDDAIADSGENFVAEIVSASGAQFEAVAVDAAANSVTTTIIDASDPTPPPGIPGIPDTPDAGATVSIDGDKTVWEGNQATYTVSTDTVSSSPIDVVVKTLEAVTNPATGDVDYISVDKTVTIPANQSSVTFTVQTTDDAIADSGENFVAEIVSASGAQFEAVAVDAAANSVTTTIIDASDPTPPPGIPGIPDTPDAGATVSIDGDKTVWEGNQATYTVSTDTVSSSPIDVVVKTLEAVTNPATGDVDYISVDKTVTIPANQSSVTFTVQTTDDAIADSGENFVAEIVSASGAQFEAVAVDAAANSVTTTIIDASDPTPPPGIPGIPDTPDAGATVSIDGDKTVWEGNQATYTVSTDTVSSSPIDVVVKTLEAVTNPATGDVDYISVDKTVTIPANQSSVTFTVQTTDDAIADSGENFVAEIVSASGAQFEAVAVDAAANSVTTTIIDASDPTPPPGIPGIPDTPDAGATVSIDGDKTVWEGNQATYTVSTDTVSSSPIDVVVKTLEAVTNPATGDVDYISVDKTVTIPANQSSVTFTVQTTDDAIADSGENFVAEIVSASGAQFEAVAVDAAANSVTTTIIDASDPTPPPGIPGIPDTPDSGTELSLSGSTSTLEGDAVEYTLSVTNAPLADMVIEITTSNITTNGDVVVGTQNVTIPAGLTEAKFTIDNVEDAIKENPEDYKVEITNYGTGGYEAVSLGQAEVITTITDDDSVTVVSITDDTQTEGTANNNLVHTVTMSGQSTTDEVYSFSLVDTTTQAVDHGTPVFSDGVSYDANTGLITVPAGVTSFTVSTTVTDDALADSGEYYTLTIGGQTATGTILDETNPYDPNNPDQPNEKDVGATVSIDGDKTVWEGNQATYTVSTDTVSSSPIDVVVKTLEAVTNPATGDVDYISVDKTVTIPANQSSVTFTVQTTDDAIADSGENFVAEIVSASGAQFEAVAVDAAANSVTTTIIDASDPTPPPGIPGIPDTPDAGATVSIDGDKTVWEGNQATYTVSTDTVSSSPIDVVVKTLEAVTNPATGDVDYISVDKTVTIPANQSSVTFTVQTTDDAIADSGENFVAEIVSASGAQFEAVAVDAAANSVTTTIIDASDPTPPPGIPGIPDTPDAGATVSIDGDKTVWEGNQATYTVSTDTVSSSPIDVVVKTLEAVTNPATGDVDYISVDKTVTIPANQSSATFTVQTTDDAIADSGENFVAEIVSASGAQFEAVAVDAAANSVTTTIIDASDPTPPPGIPGIPDTPDAGATVSIDGDKTVWEGNQATYTVSTDTVSSSPIDVVVKTLEAVTNPATGDVDYISVDKTVTIPANQSSVTFTVQTTDDAIADSGENFVAEIVSASGAQFEAVAVDAAANSVTTTIIDASDPTPPPGIPGIPDTPDAGATVSIDGDKTVWEGNQATYTVSTDTVSSSPIDVVVKTLEAVTNPATGDVDYISVDKTVTIPANQSSVTFTVQTTDDAIADSGENFVAEIVSASGAQFEAVAVDAAANSVTTTIIDASDPTPPPGIPGIPDTPDSGTELSLSGSTSTLEGDAVEYTLSVTNAPLADMVIEITTSNITTNGDVVVGTQNVTIPAGLTEAKFTIDNVEDAIKENPEDYKVEITNYGTGGYEAVSLGQAEVITTITDDDSVTVVSITDDTQTEGTANNNLVHTVTMSGQSTTDEVYSFSLVDTTTQAVDHGTPVFSDGVSYDANTGLITVPAGVTSFTVSTTVTDDALADSGEYYTLTIGGQTATGTILDETNPYDPNNPDQPNEKDVGATVSIDGDKTVWEGNQATYTVSTDTVSSSPIDVVVKTLEAVTNPATGDVDYISVDKTVTIPANQSSATFTVQTTDDAIADSGENFVAEIVSASGAQFEAVAVDAAANSVTTTIIDASDPTPPPGIPGIPDTPDSGTELSLSGSTSTLEGDAVEYTLSVTNAPLADMVIEITTSNITTNGDVVVGTQNVTIPAGLTEAKFTIDNVEDAIKENSEDYKVEITNYGTGGYEAVSLGQAEVITTITDDDESPSSTPIVDQSDEDSDLITLDVSSSFTDDNSLTYSATGLPPGLTIDPSTGVISGTIDHSASQGGTNSDGVYTVTISATDGANPPTEQTFNWDVSNPSPIAEDDSGSVLEDATLTVTAANGVINGNGQDVDPDGDSLTVSAIRTGSETGSGTSGNVSTPLVGVYGSLTLNPDGSYTYIANQPAANALSAGQSVTDTFTYTVSDGEGGSDTAELVINVTGTNDGPVCGHGDARVSEELLAGGIEDTIGSSDLGAGKVYTGSLSVSDVDTNDTLSVTLTAPTTIIKSDGVTIQWSGDGTAANPLIGTAGSDEIIRAVIDNNGDYTVTLSGPVDHTYGDNIEGELSFDLGVNVSDGIQSANNTLTVTVEDDSPDAQPTTNVMDVNLDVIEIRNYSAGWSNPISTASDNSGISQFNNDSDSYIDELQWGSGTDGPSGYDLVDNQILSSNVSTTVNAGDSIVLGTFTHNNFPVTGETLDSVTLTMQMDILINGVTYPISFDIPIDHNETPNDGADPRDIITLPSTQQTVTVDNQDYIISIDGFKDANGDAVEVIYTNEGEANTFEVVGSVQSVDSLPTVTGTVSAEAGADGSDTGVVWDTITSPYGTFTGNADGSYEFTLNRETKDALQDGETLQATFDYTMTDNDGDSTTSTLTVDINGHSVYEDLQPQSIDEVRGMDFTSDALSQDTNVVITLDISGSMTNNSSNVNRLALAKDALGQMLNAYDTFGNVNVKLVTFSSSATASQWMSVTDAINAINALSAGGSTNYEDAVLKTYTNFASTEPVADKTVAYFISDGEPTAENNDGGNAGPAGTYLDVNYIDGWNTFVDNNVDDLHVIALGEGITNIDYLDVLANAGNVETTIVTDESELADTLAPELTVSGGAFDNIGSGTTLDNISGGNGTISIDHITVDGVDYNANDFPTTGIEIAGQGNLTFDFTTGQYSYSGRSTEFASDTMKTFGVTAVDQDGDPTSFDVRIFVNVESSTTSEQVITSENFDSGLTGWSSNADTSNGELRIQRDETVSKTFDYGVENANQTVTVSFDMNIAGGWELSGGSKDYFKVFANGIEKESQFNSIYDGNDNSTSNDGHQYEFEAQLDSQGHLTLELQVDSTANDEIAFVDNLQITQQVPGTPEEGLILYGDDNEIENFVINSQEDAKLVDFDTTNDVLDLSEVINSDEAVTQDNLAEYLNFAFLDSSGNEVADQASAVSTQITIDANGESDPGGAITTVVLQDRVVTEDDINDLNIDYQHD
ncbi:Calx-beta domain-containing protein [Thiomicrorhabdus sp.]|uniref:Calx-beta domain-containing protein n=1 Tax=Thiomicrorhabdus sp. TaxID=2039724 RepID=UPI002AA91C63|nr:Calx-beta domain-containing protein [Thiomicrorhabdus sp.]